MKLIDDFKPPIRTRSDKEIIKIVASPQKWNSKAVKIAREEIAIRKIDSKPINQAKYLEEKKDKIEAQKIANESFCFFTIDPFEGFIDWGEVAIFLFSWELEKDGFIRKAKFQRTYRPVIIILFLLAFFIFF